MLQFEDVAKEIASNENLTNVHFVGKGAFKETYCALSTNDQRIALKIFDPAKCNIERATRELDAMIRCSSPKIGKIFKASHHVIATNTYNYSLEEFIGGGTLADMLESSTLTNESSRLILRDIGQALICTKALNIVHRDIKPANIMVREDSTEFVLVDFGLVRDLSKESLTMSWVSMGPGTPLYMAPEQLTNDKTLISWKTDQFSLGIMIAICLTGRHPFSMPDDTNVECLERVANHCPPSVWFQKLAASSGFEAVSKMIQPWPIRRFNTPEEIVLAAEGVQV